MEVVIVTVVFLCYNTLSDGVTKSGFVCKGEYICGFIL